MSLLENLLYALIDINHAEKLDFYHYYGGPKYYEFLHDRIDISICSTMQAQHCQIKLEVVGSRKFTPQSICCHYSAIQNFLADAHHIMSQRDLVAFGFATKHFAMDAQEIKNHALAEFSRLVKLEDVRPIVGKRGFPCDPFNDNYKLVYTQYLSEIGHDLQILIDETYFKPKSLLCPGRILIRTQNPLDENDRKRCFHYISLRDWINYPILMEYGDKYQQLKEGQPLDFHDGNSKISSKVVQFLKEVKSHQRSVEDILDSWKELNPRVAALHMDSQLAHTPRIGQRKKI